LLHQKGWLLMEKDFACELEVGAYAEE